MLLQEGRRALHGRAQHVAVVLRQRAAEHRQDALVRTRTRARLDRRGASCRSSQLRPRELPRRLLHLRELLHVLLRKLLLGKLLLHKLLLRSELLLRKL